MKKYIYGLVDNKTKSLGDLCLLDRDEVFRDGIVSLLSDPSVPDYLVNDLVGYCFGFVSISDDATYPDFHIFSVPQLIISGLSIEVQAKRKEDSDFADLPENS